jgi:hypothetical protein
LGIQSVITRVITVAEGRFAPGHLGELTQLVPFEMVDEALTQTRTVQSRIRALPSRVVVYLLLAACLFPEGYAGVGGSHGGTGYPRAYPVAELIMVRADLAEQAAEVVAMYSNMRLGVG